LAVELQILSFHVARRADGAALTPPVTGVAQVLGRGMDGVVVRG
jgi:hypothetical protein